MRKKTVTEEWTCDRCGAEMMPRSYNIEHSVVVVRAKGYDYNGNGAGGGFRYDLCQECTVALRAWLAPRSSEAIDQPPHPMYAQADMEMRGALAWEGYAWGSPTHLLHAAQGVLEALRKARTTAEVLRRERDGEVWVWQGDGRDNPASLTCPVLMRADDLRVLLKEGR